jgi:hypothetical protein
MPGLSILFLLLCSLTIHAFSPAKPLLAGSWVRSLKLPGKEWHQEMSIGLTNKVDATVNPFLNGSNRRYVIFTLWLLFWAAVLRWDVYSRSAPRQTAQLKALESFGLSYEGYEKDLATLKRYLVYCPGIFGDQLKEMKNKEVMRRDERQRQAVLDSKYCAALWRWDVSRHSARRQTARLKALESFGLSYEGYEKDLATLKRYLVYCPDIFGDQLKEMKNKEVMRRDERQRQAVLDR